jgi:protoporphyrinogen oxidase
MNKTSVLIIGSGLSGLAAARQLNMSGVDFIILESDSKPGGRVKTDNHDGYLLDHGFQVYLDAYSEGKRTFNYEKLKLHPFDAGALLLLPGGKTSRFFDPIKHPKKLFSILSSTLGSWEDKLNLFSLKTRLLNQRNSYLFEKNDYPTAKVLDRYGFSQTLQNHFLKPFYRGIFLERDLETSRRMFDFLFKMFAKGRATLPENGMESLIVQLVDSLPANSILFGKTVSNIDKNKLITEDGSSYFADQIIIATALDKLSPLLNHSPSLPEKKQWRGCTTVYFKTYTPPYKDKLIALNTLDNPLVNNLAVLSNINPSYAPEGQCLISATILGIDDREDSILADAIKLEMSKWFKSAIDDWELLKVYRIPNALPNVPHVSYDIEPNSIVIDENIYLCGDHMLQGSIQGALRSGRQAAELLIQQVHNVK